MVRNRKHISWTWTSGWFATKAVNWSKTKRCFGWVTKTSRGTTENQRGKEGLKIRRKANDVANYYSK